MNFVKIELRGFKSFADKVEIPFKEGVTAIIGPNGCGKSNVADAIRWTLGEQSAKSLRGKSMADVIFAGTEKRKSMSYCEVSLYFNNEDHTIFPSLPFNEVVITRKLDRGGLSEYYINKTRCRMKDIINLFHDTGIGKEGYSIIGQGRIDEILSQKPDDRRNIFEEAAGISKFRARRNEAENNLQKTYQNLQTTNELIAEIERQLGPLRKQAETAEKYFALKEELKKNEVNLYIYNFENNQNIKQKINDRLDASREKFKITEKELNETITSYENYLQELSGIDKTYESQSAELLTLKVDEEKVSGQANLLKERIQNISNEILRLNDELRDVDVRLQTATNLITNTEAKKEEELTQMLALSRELDSTQDKLDSITKTLQGQETDLEKSNREYVEAIEQLSEIRNNYSGYMSEKGINEERSNTLKKLLNEKKAQLDSENTALSIADANAKKAREELRSKLEAYNEALSNKNDAEESLTAYNEDLQALNLKLSTYEANLKLQLAIKNEYQGYQEAVKRLMRDAQDDPVLKNKMIGVIAELITVPSEYESAIEYSLGQALQNIVVSNEHDASDLIAYLKQRNYGRVTFRPLTTSRPHTLVGSNRDVLNETGCLGIASDLISYDSNIRDVMETLLGATVVVDNMANATRLFKKYNQAFKIVTLDGDIFSRGGEITGGSRRLNNSGLLSQEKQIEQLEANIERTKKNIASYLSQKDERKQEIQDCIDEMDSIMQSTGELKVAVQLNEEKSKQALENVDRLNAEIEETAKEYQTAFDYVKEINEKIGSISQLEEIVKNKQSAYNQSLSSTKQQSSENATQKDTLQSQVMDLKVKVAQANSNISSLDTEIFRYKRDNQEAEQEKLDIISQLKIQQGNLDRIQSAPEKKVFSKEDQEKIKALETDIQNLSSRKTELNELLKVLDGKRNTLNEEKSKIDNAIVRDNAMLENVDIEIRHQQEHILEDYNLTYTGCLEYKDPEFKSYGAQTVITELRRSIGKLGEVNPLALETLKETEARHEEKVSQRDDIQAAYDDINKVIAELTEEMSTKFTTAFDKINENFKETFQQLFGGGKGELRLNFSETEDPLEAGIDIYAQPPGKKLQNINLLSGGEKAVTAISILFAILMLKPMPFCVLDEIDAALDDSNANLFADFLKKFSNETQFIVITHRKPTMRHADSIFGVTMEEKGVTKIVSIEFEEAIKHASDN